MKSIKGFIPIIFVTVIAAFAFMSIYTGRESISKSEADVAHTSLSSQAELLYEFKSIDDLIKNADCIVVGKVENAEQFMESNMDTYKYSFKVDKYLKGEENSNQIDLYEGKDEVHVGDKYLLFLDSWESELYPNPLHTSIASDISIIKIKGNSLLGDSRIIGKMDKEQLIHLISKSPLLTVKQKKSYNIKDKAKDAEDLINSSDYVVHIIPHSVVKFNQNVALWLAFKL